MSDFGLKPSPDTPAKPAQSVSLIDQIKPRPLAKPLRNLQEIDNAAAEAGFSSREPYTRSTMQRPTRNEPTQGIAMRPYVSIVARFHKYAKMNGLSLPLSLEQLLDESDELAQLRASKP
jgi:hypothetical protein